MNDLTILKLPKSKQLTNIKSSIFREENIFINQIDLSNKYKQYFLNGFISLYEVMNKQR